MATLIKERRIAADIWRLLRPGADDALPVLSAPGDVVVPLALWQMRRDELVARAGRTGVWLEANEGPEPIAADLGRLALVAVNFPKFGDGRGYSTARLLRERYAYTGEVRAVGNVLQDQLPLLEKCGFDAFMLREDQDPEQALRAFDDFSESYQTSVAQPVPLFRRRSATTT